MKDGKLSYLTKVPEVESTAKYYGYVFNRGSMVDKPALKNCKLFLQGSILFVSDVYDKENLYNIIFL